MSKRSPPDDPPRWPLSRREFLGTAAGGLAGLALGCSSGPFDPEAVPESRDIFPRTPMAGEMKPSSFLVSGHVETGEEVTLRVWQRGADGGALQLLVDQPVTPDERGFLKVAVDGLSPGQWYEYALFAGGLSSRSLIGRVRTALPDGSTEPVRIAIAACVGSGVLPEYVSPHDPQPYDPWPTMQQAAQQDYDVFIHLGDQAYMDQVYDAGGTLEQYLAAWGAYHGGGYRVVYPRTGLYCTWDDHEVTNNGTVDPWTTVPEERRRIDDAIHAYYTVMPIDAEQPHVDPLWRSFRWGDTVEFIVLDCRYERQPPETGIYLGEAQLAFLLDRLANSPCHFKCVVNSVPFANLGLPEDNALFNQLVNPLDRWQGYATQRAEVQAFVDANDVRNVLWITGDVHMCYVGQVDSEPATYAEGMWEVCVTSGNTNPLASELPAAQFPWRSENAHLPLITFDPTNDQVVVEFIATDGSLAHRRELDLG